MDSKTFDKLITTLHSNKVNGREDDVVAHAIEGAKHLLDLWYSTYRTPEGRRSHINLVNDAAALVSRIADVHRVA